MVRSIGKFLLWVKEKETTTYAVSVWIMKFRLFRNICWSKIEHWNDGIYWKLTPVGLNPGKQVHWIPESYESVSPQRWRFIDVCGISSINQQRGKDNLRRVGPENLNNLFKSQLSLDCCPLTWKNFTSIIPAVPISEFEDQVSALMFLAPDTWNLESLSYITNNLDLHPIQNTYS